MNVRFLCSSLLCLLIFLIACSPDSPAPTPKPRAYPRIDFPEYTYQQFDEDYCSFTFQYPSYAEIVQDEYFFGEEPIHPCWFDLYIPAFDSRLYCSYLEAGQEKSLDELRTDAFEMADYHTKRANYIDELRIDRRDEAGVEGFAFAIEGPAATPFQFYLTDGDDHFFRASLYFNTQVRPDSLQPIYQFIREDIMRMIETFEWTE